MGGGSCRHNQQETGLPEGGERCVCVCDRLSMKLWVEVWRLKLPVYKNMKRVCKVLLRESTDGWKWLATVLWSSSKVVFLKKKKLCSFSCWFQNTSQTTQSSCANSMCVQRVTHTRFVNSQMTSEAGNSALTLGVQRKTLICAPLLFLVSVNHEPQNEKEHWMIPPWLFVLVLPSLF